MSKNIFITTLLLLFVVLSLPAQHFTSDSIKDKTDTFLINGNRYVFDRVIGYVSFDEESVTITLLKDTQHIKLLDKYMSYDGGDEFSMLYLEARFEVRNDSLIFYTYKSVDGYVVNGRPPTDIWTKEIYVFRKSGELICISSISSGYENSRVATETGFTRHH